MRPRHIEIHIDRIVVHGADPSDRHAIGDAITSELTRLLAESGLPPALLAAGERGVVRAELDTSGAARGAALGTGVAGALYRGVSR